MRIIKIENDIVTEVKFLSDGYECRENEYISEIGELGQRYLADGTFEDVEQEVIEPQSTIEERLDSIESTIAYNQLQTEYLVILAEFNAL